MTARTRTQQRAAMVLAAVCYFALSLGGIALAFALRGAPGP